MRLHSCKTAGTATATVAAAAAAKAAAATNSVAWAGTGLQKKAGGLNKYSTSLRNKFKAIKLQNSTLRAHADSLLLTKLSFASPSLIRPTCSRPSYLCHSFAPLPSTSSSSSSSPAATAYSAAALKGRRQTLGHRTRSTLSGLETTMAANGDATTKKSHLLHAQDLCTFLDSSWTAYHAVETACKSLLSKGFTRLDEGEVWPTLEQGGKYFYTRNTSSLVAFVVGMKAEPGCGVAVVGAHTDSPCPKLKPLTKLTKSGHLLVACQPYGGGLWHTWFDRDLAVAGRLIVKGSDGKSLHHKLVKINKPIMRIPTLAIHLDRGINSDGFKVNVQNHLQPLLAMQSPNHDPDKDASSIAKYANGNGASANGNGASANGNGVSANGNGNEKKKEGGRHHALLLKMLAEAALCQPNEIADFELQLCDTQKASIGGARDEFVFSGRLDNLAMSYCSLRALENAAVESIDVNGVMMIALFDHEEVGSSSAQGAGSPIMGEAVRRITKNLAKGDNESMEPWGSVNRALRKSMVVSADMAHAVHPNYSEKHDSLHMPKLGEGVCIKHSANQRYSSDAVSSFMFRECGVRDGCSSQDFVIRSDMACGSTIGPIVSANTGIRTVDVGIPQLSMHSIREMCHVKDIEHAINHFRAFYKNFWTIDSTLKVDSTLIEQMPELHNDVGCEHLH